MNFFNSKAQGAFVSLSGESELLAKVAALGPKARAAARQALNHGARKGRAELVRTVTRDLNLKAGYVRSRVTLRLASGQTDSAAIIAKERPVLLTRFGARQKYRTRKGKRRTAGVRVKVSRQGGTKLMPGAFVVRLQGSNAMAVATPAPGKFETGNRRFEVKYGPSVTQVFRRTHPDLAAFLRLRMRNEFERQLNRRLIK